MGSTHHDPAKLTDKFRDLQRDLWLRGYLMSVSSFDGQTVAPKKGVAARAEAQAALAGERHALQTGKKSRKLVRRLEQAAAEGELGDQVLDELRVFSRDQREASAIPADETAAWTRLTCEAEAAWHDAKEHDDWASFEPYVDRILETLKRHAAYLDDTRDPYDVWLDQYERGLTTERFDAFCDAVRATVVPLVHEIGTRPQPESDFLGARVPQAAQMAISRDLMALAGLDMDGMALALTEHPFTDGLAAGDTRIATHIYEDNAVSNVYSMIHESGHAIYEQRVNPDYAYTCLATGTSMGIHESQSRFFENIVGRSRAFMGPLLAVLRRHAPEVYEGVSEDRLYRAVNIATPSLIRTEADELTYPLHIMIRYEIERLLFSGEARARDIPALWERFTKEYLGIDVPNDAQGCLQDTHWSGGAFGYFPTYALGSAYGAQFAHVMRGEGVDIEAAAAAGDLAPVNAWLEDKIWRWGRAKDADEIIEGACGAPFDVTYYCDYLSKKFTDLYRL